MQMQETGVLIRMENVHGCDLWDEDESFVDNYLSRTSFDLFHHVTALCHVE